MWAIFVFIVPALGYNIRYPSYEPNRQYGPYSNDVIHYDDDDSGSYERDSRSHESKLKSKEFYK